MDDYVTRVANKLRAALMDKIQRQRSAECPYCKGHFLITENRDEIVKDERFVEWFINQTAACMESELNEEAAIENAIIEDREDGEIEDCPGCLGQGYELGMNANIIKCPNCQGAGKVGELDRLQIDLLAGFQHARISKKSDKEKQQIAALKIQQMAAADKRNRNKNKYYNNKWGYA